MQLRLINWRGSAPSKPPLSVLLNYNLDDAHHQAAAWGTATLAPLPCAQHWCGGVELPSHGGITPGQHHEEVASLGVPMTARYWQ